MRLRRLNTHGIERFGTFLDALTSECPLQYPNDLVAGENDTEEVKPSVDMERRPFDSRLDISRYLHEILGQTDIPNIDRDVGLWSWLALFYFYALCPNKHGKHRPGERARWILMPSGWRAYRHLLAGPYRIFDAHRDNPQRALSLLCGPPHQVSDIYLELADSQELITNKAVIETATRLYLNPKTGKPKRMTARDYPGGARRLAEVLSQFDVTWDLYSLDAEALFSMLPQEFDRFKATD